MPTDLELCVRLNRMLDWQIQLERKFDLYYHGRQPVGNIPDNVRAEVPNLPVIKLNFGRLVVDSLEERLDVSGFKVGDERISRELWEVFQRSNGDELSQMAHLDALIHGRSYVMVWADPRTGYPKLSAESARHAIVFQMPGLSHRIAGLKRWVDGEGQPYCTLFTPTTITRWKSPNRIALDPWLNPSTVGNPAYAFDSYSFYDWSQLPSTGWELREEPRPNPLGCVPLVPLVNKPRLLNPMGESELQDALPIIDGINFLAQAMLVTAEYSAMPRRWATGLDLTTDADGNVVDPFTTLKGRVWLAESETTNFGQFPEATLGAYGDAIARLTEQLAAISGLPQYLFGSTREPASADSIRSSEQPLVKKAMRRQRAFGGSWEEAMRLAHVVLTGLKNPALEAMETVWADPETRTVAQASDAALKLRQIGVPLPQIAEDLGYSPQEVARMPADEVLAGARSNGAPPPDSPETQRETRREGEIAAR